MRTETTETDRIIYRVGKVGIGRYTYGWFACDIGTTGEKSKTPGVEALRNQSFHGRLADACESAALRIADNSTARSLEGYARELRAAIADLKRAVGCQLDRPKQAVEPSVGEKGSVVAPPPPAKAATRQKGGTR